MLVLVESLHGIFLFKVPLSCQNQLCLIMSLLWKLDSNPKCLCLQSINQGYITRKLILFFPSHALHMIETVVAQS